MKDDTAVPVARPKGNSRQRHQRRRQKEMEGLRRLNFVVPVALWDRWMERHPRGDGKVNDMFIAWLEAGVEVLPE